MREGNALQVFYDGKLVGTLAMTADHKAAFQYDDEWLENGFAISPFSLPLKNSVMQKESGEVHGVDLTTLNFCSSQMMHG